MPDAHFWREHRLAWPISALHLHGAYLGVKPACGPFGHRVVFAEKMGPAEDCVEATFFQLAWVPADV